MKTGLFVLVIGILVSIFFGSNLYMSMTNDGLGGGYGVMFFGYPLIIIGIIITIYQFIKSRKN